MDTDLKSLFAGHKKSARQLRSEAIRNRKERLKALRNWIQTNRHLVHAAIYEDLAKPSAETDGTEIFSVLSEIRFVLNNLDRWTKPQKIDAPLEFLGTRSWVLHEPKGVTLIIAPWNYPFTLCISPLVSALSAGNTVILKPSELSPNTSAVIRQMIEATLDPAVVRVVEGDADVSQQLLSLPFDHIFFTGSPAIGKLVMKAAAENLTSVTLELGGKSPAIVTATTRIKDAAKRIAVTKFINNGQTCIAPDYVLVDESVKDEFVSELVNETKRRFATNNGSFEQSPHYARIIDQRHFKRLSVLLDDAIRKGAKPVMNGRLDEPGRFFHPAILTDVPLSASIMEEEIFGPVLPVISYKQLNEAIDLVLNKPKPLALYVFSQKKNEWKKVLNLTSSGGVCINDCAIQFLNHNLPFGGIGTSGIGKSHGYAGFQVFSNEKPVIKQRNGLSTFDIFYPPYTSRVRQAMNLFLKLF